MKQIIFAIALLVLIAGPAAAQQEEKLDTTEYFDLVEHPPTIVGGLESLSKNLKYPEAALRDSVQGMVYVCALIAQDGSIDKATIEKSDNDMLSEAALTAVKAIRFNPGKNQGKSVKTKVMIPVKFKLQ
ncbi:MAG: energy transducer TonB [Bacteroidota bacterium]